MQHSGLLGFFSEVSPSSWRRGRGSRDQEGFSVSPFPFQFRPPFIDCIVKGTFKRGKEKSCRHERDFPALDAREMRVSDSRPRFPYES